MTKFRYLAAALFTVFLLSGPTSAEEKSPAGAKKLPAEHLRFFESQVRPLLAGRCLECHGAEKQKGELRLDSRAGMLKGGDSGPALVPGKPEESLLVEAVRYESFEMPPTGQLPEKEIAVLIRWIELGAPWPGDDDFVIRREASDKITEKDRAWWAFQPLRQPEIPAADGDGWARNEIDRFILTKMQAEGLSTAPEADRAALIRRLFFDLVGLPPTPQQVEAFVADESPQAYERLVDELLESPQYGERWARHWLDLVRYADSDGYRIDHYRPNAWRYRDYVIRSFNDDKPYDRFVQEQLAGDELFPGDPEALIATGYLRHVIYEYNNRDVRGQWETILDDLTDTTGDVFLGMGMQCARCHDHKFDPILQRDYYRLQAFFAPILPRDDLTALTADQRREYDERLKVWEEKTADLRRKIDEIESRYRTGAAKSAVEKFPDDIQAMINKPVGERAPLEHQLAELAYRQVDFEYTRLDSRFKGEDKEAVLALRKELAAFDKLRPEPLPMAMAVTDASAEPPPTVVPGHSNEVIEPGFLTVLDEMPAAVERIPEAPSSTGRRAALARWMTQPDNPLTTRVIANRVWQYHFGRGLAPNSSDFGHLGGEPTHPELLDWLTVQFVRDGWSFKKLHKRIVTSATYRQSTNHPRFQEFQQINPDNRFYWRGETRRLEAEQIRDAILAVTGQLNPDAGGPGVNPDVPRRSVYTRFMRNARDPLLDVFDLPQFFASTSSRDTTTTPVQSLLLINSQQMLRHASKLADRAWNVQETSGAGEMSARVENAWRLAYGRSPTAEERTAALEFLAHQVKRIAPAETAPTANQVATGKVPYRNGQAVLLQPDGPQTRLHVPHDPRLEMGDFTVEAFFQLRSIYDSGAVRTVAAKWLGEGGKPGWAFGVTGKGSRRKPQTLVLQIYGTHRNGKFGEAALFSDQHIELNKPYYAAASVKLAGDEPGKITFYLKDLSNDDEPLLVAEMPLEITGGFANTEPLTIGGRSGPRTGQFDGLMDDVRITRGALGTGQLLFTSETLTKETVGYWQFEVEPGLFRDSSPHNFDIRPLDAGKTASDPTRTAFVDLCHALLNSNEFLYAH